MKISESFPGKYVKAAELGGVARVATISHVEKEWIGQGQDAEEKLVVYFQGKDQGMVLNKTNANSIVELHGDDTDDWTGKPIVMFPSTCQMGSKTVDCIRIRAAKTTGRSEFEDGKASKPAPKPAPAAEEFEAVDDDMRF